VIFRVLGSLAVGAVISLSAVLPAHADTIHLLPPPTASSNATTAVSPIDTTLYTRGDSQGADGRVAKGAESARGATAGSTVTATSTCPQGQKLQGGSGAVQTNDGSNHGSVSQSYASGPSSWTFVGVVADSGLAADEALDVVAVALCAN
jgi:hypothetical protein